MAILTQSTQRPLIPGPAGSTAYQLALANGFSGTLQQWLASLAGTPGVQGSPGLQGDQGPQGVRGEPGAGLDTITSTGMAVVEASDARTGLAALNGAAATRTEIENGDYSASFQDVFIAYTSLEGDQTVTLPLAADYPPGQTLWVADESGNCSTTDTITIVPSGSDTIAGQASEIMASPYQKLAFHSNRNNLWTVS